MKKILVVLAAVAFVATLASCKKTCTCTGYVNGVAVAESAEEIELDGTNYKKCSELNSVITVDGKETGTKCE